MRALRGRRSQPAFSRLLGFRSNTVYSWESGRRHPEVSLFLRAALAGGRNARRKLADFFELPAESFEGRRGYSARTVRRLVEQLVGRSAKSVLARELDVDRTTLGRWCLGKTEPRLPEFLRLVQLSTQRLLQFVGVFIDPSKLDSTRASHAHLMGQQRLAYDLPLSHAVLRALELTAYGKLPRHSATFLATEVGLTEREVVRYLEELEATGQALRDGERYSVAEILTIDTREDPEQNRRLKQFWAKEALDRFESRRTSADTLFSFNLFAISESSYQKIRELHLAYYERLRALIEQSETADRVVLMNLQLVPLRAPEKP
jgi:DNA-binding transcriptional regulator YiaG